ncbi:Pleiotropic drug resistance protein 1 [Glycine soja]|uniref:Pleiotropic drug resistance protein 1 n=1 Tax=Glycine soja TaxID=3848 RepID=A0A445FHQ3_GLYSO|nr:Pleiotropic drug resistance protein 1 [Glycine soja]
MEDGGSVKAGSTTNTMSSFRIGSRSVWSNSGVEIFANSFHQEDDEEALKWAAIQKLPTFARLRTGLMTSPEGVANEVNVHQLGLQERRGLLERLVRVAEEDNEKFMLKLRDRIDRVGITIPTIEVRFENMNIGAEVHVGSRALPTFTNYMVNKVEGLLNFLHVLPSRKQRINILQNVSGIIRPARMTLLLGPPSSGKTTLLLALAGRLDSKLKFTGKVTYNGHGMNEFVPQRTAAYVSQNDLHIGEMTVRETLAFSARVQGVGARYDLLAEVSRREKEANIKPDPDIDVYMKAVATEGQKANFITDYILRILGLEVCADTIVGNAMLRGISGGQRKRVTTGEMLVGPAKAVFMDEISTGLDSSTTFQVVNSLKHFIHSLKGTAVVSLLQPAPETYNLFDDIILLSDGQIVYQGPREHVLEFFASVGFKCPERKGVADFLQEVTSRKDQEQYWVHRDQPYRFVTTEEFVEAFQSFHVGRSLADELATQFDKSKSHPAALATKMYGLGKWELLKACLSREYLLMKRNSFVHIFQLCQLAIVAFIAMTVFFRTEMHPDSVTSGGIYAGALFYGLLVILLDGFADLTMTVSKLPVFYKQRDFLFFPSWVYALPAWILKIPMTFAQVGIWVFLTYYVIGFDPYVGRFFRQFLLLLFVNQMASALFRFIGALGRELTVAFTIGSFVLAILIAMSGFILSKGNMKKWWLWGFWSSPMMYGLNAMINNEFQGKRWRHVLPNSTTPLGVQVLKSRGFFTQSKWYWIGVGALIGYTIVFNIAYILALTYLNPIVQHQAVKSEKSQSNEQDGGSTSARSSSRRKEADRRRGMALPFEPHSITFDDVTYSVDMPQEMKNQGVLEDRLNLLKGVSGTFRPGVLTALMGSTGAGKTTLMDVLAGRKTGGYIGGNITISGYPKKQETFARISGYCEQNDIHSPYVTVYESLLYSAWLRLSAEINSETRKMFIEEVIELVELNPLKHTIVGLPGVNGLSTEQRKRLTISVELVANPSIIFMDEPTSGLDARAAAVVMRAIRKIVDTGRTVVCTIHQPSIDIFESFDELFLMKRGGQEIYVGPLGHHSYHLISYFEGIKGVRTIEDGYNPATWMLEVTTSAKEMELGIDFAELYKNSDLYRRNKELIEELSTPAPGSKDLYFSSKYSRSFITQCMACLWKQHWSYWRNNEYTALRFLFTIAVALLFGSIYWNLGSKIKKQQDLFNAMGSMYAAVLLLGIKNSNSAQPLVAVERTVFYREKAAGMYSALAYAFAQAMSNFSDLHIFLQVVVELPHVLLQTVVYSAIVYAMIGFEWSVTKFFWYLFFMYFTFLYFTYYGMMSAAMTPNPSLAVIISSGFYEVWNLFSGFIIPRPRMPVWWRWYYWANPVAWTLYGLVTSQFGDIQDHIEFNGRSTTVEDFLRNYFGFKHDFLGVVAAVLIGFAVTFALIFAIAIKMLNFQRR